MKALLYSFVGCLYVMQLALFGWAMMFFNDVPFAVILIVVASAFGIAAVALCAVNLAVGISQAYKSEYCGYKTVMIVKLVLVPYFIINFIYGFFITAAGLNPFLFMALIFVLPLMVVFTYASMLATSAYNLGAMMGKIKRRETTFGEIALVFISQLVFFLDVAGSILLYIRYRESEKRERI